MKHLKRFLSLLLALCMILAVLGGCTIPTFSPENTDTSGNTQNTTHRPSLKDYLDENISVLNFILTEQDLADFKAKIPEIKQKMLAATTCADAERELEILMLDFEHIRRQDSIAEVLYYCHQSDEKTTENYLFAKRAISEAYMAMVELEKEIYYANPPYRDEYFEGMTEEELEAAILESEEESRHTQQQSEITSEFYSNEDYADRLQVYKLYTQFLKSGTSLAEKAGYENYYDYASENYYFRDYGKEERDRFRSYVKTYIVPIYRQAYDTFYEKAEKLSKNDMQFLIDLLDNESFDGLDKNYLMNYLNSLSGTTKDGMMHMFDNKFFLCADWEDAHEGAFTTRIYAPFCYFGPGYYQSTFTVAHELGHYYASLHTLDDNFCYDLAETHSQGNEMLLMHYLRRELSADVYEVLVYYKIYSISYAILMATLLDHFEETVYSMPELCRATSNEPFDAVMKQILPQYNLPKNLEESFSNLWREICIVSPIYYLSYATSAVTALNLYSMCQKDEAAALESYRKLVEEQNPEGGFTENLNNAGIPSPFEESSFGNIKALIKQ